ncbi:ATP-binding cassette domain-containing protein [Clostridium sp. AL.422]|uniref:ABC transporter ATP-binding protein n=1 Tax=Clostridium TaxID=1485 RepID=UPI00293DA484|nr:MULTISPECIES: oligopeptide/dipeptide ABC transporter ATP-binding protein [unclassified Clostridium]MDV4150455.1 ATP-binding cassette domain-containing protein [Clostridium sp. AL.422]
MSEENNNEYILQVQNLKKWYPIKKGIFSRATGNIKAVDGVSFNIKPGETLGIVGESGCGKSTLGKTLIRSIEPTSGRVIFDGQDITKLNKRKLKIARKKMKLIFYDPYDSLNPRITVKDIIAERIDIQKTYKTSEERDKKIEEVMKRVGLNKECMNAYANEFSGGQRLRIRIARAMILDPKLVICDETVFALDVSVQTKIIDLLKELQKEKGVAYIFISNNLSVVEHIADRVAVMYLGKIVEISGKKELYRNPKHPYTKALLSAIPKIDGASEEDLDDEKVMLLEGDIPSPANPPKGCRFNTRCPSAKEICFLEEPELKIVEDDHLCACHFEGIGHIIQIV